MAARPIISYDDITLPYEPPENGAMQPPSRQPPTKRRKKNNQKGKHAEHNSGRSNQKSVSFAQVPGANPSDSSYSTTTAQVENEAYTEEADEGEYEAEESRELTHNDIWDDSALVDAWEAAQQEYEMYHGKNEDWKKEPVKKSALWYNVPFDPSTQEASDATLPNTSASVPATSTVTTEGGTESDSKPINFDTFVPTYDPSLPTPATSGASYEPDTPAGPMVSQDEAFARAMNAMYWGGYWTAMYHAQRQLARPAETRNAAGLEEEDMDDSDAIEESGGLITTQR